MIDKFTDIPSQAIYYPELKMFYIWPTKALSRYISKYTITFSDNNSSSDSLSIFPDGSGCIIFTYDEYSVKSLLWGTTTRTFIVNNNLNAYPMQLFIELLPGALFCLTGIKQSTLTNLQIPLCQVNNELHSLISEAFESAESLDSLIHIVNSILFSILQRRAMPEVLLSTLSNINNSKGCISVKELSRVEYYSERHLNRIFNDYIGTSIKTFSSIIRINHLLQAPINSSYLTDIAHTSGFYDQAHFNHNFKAICGITPKKYFEKMSDFYNESRNL